VTGADPVSATQASVERIGHEKRAALAAQRAMILARAASRTGEDASTERRPELENEVQL
jgi:hypothetical protein